MTSADFFSDASAHSSRFAEAMRAHVEANDEVLSHVLMGDFVRVVGATLEAGSEANQEILGSLLGLVELGLAEGDPELVNVLAVSFVENLDCEPFFAQLQPSLGPRVLAELRSQQRG